jgi:hypothetical protein
LNDIGPDSGLQVRALADAGLGRNVNVSYFGEFCKNLSIFCRLTASLYRLSNARFARLRGVKPSPTSLVTPVRVGRNNEPERDLDYVQ